MRAIVILLSAVLAVPSAEAETVLVMAEPSAELDSALRVAMAGRGVQVAGSGSPAGALRLERAAAAQRAAMQVGADAAVWVDETDVCAVTADGHAFRQAPFPIEAATPRAFAAIATSLLDEMIRPEAWAQGFDVNVNVSVTPRPGGPRVAALPPPTFEPPGASPEFVDAVRIPAPRRHAGKTMLELGPMFSPLTAGLQAGVMFSLSNEWRLGATGAINVTFDGNHKLGIGMLEARHVGAGRTKHWDIGPEVGYASDGTDPAAFGGVRIARTWELKDSAVSLALTPMIFVILNDPMVAPAIYSSLRWQVPL